MIGVDMQPLAMHKQLQLQRWNSTTTTTSVIDRFDSTADQSTSWVEGAVIVGAGPSGLAAAACLKSKGVPFVILERADCIASLWQHRTYDRLRLHIAKNYCELPMFGYPEATPTYPTRQQFIEYIRNYAAHFAISPLFDRSVESAHYDPASKLWRLRARDKAGRSRGEFMTRWLIVATGENAEPKIPQDVSGIDFFRGEVLHSSTYTNGERFAGKSVLVVGSGNSGMEIALDLLGFNARPSIIVRSPTHILPKQMFGKSTFGIAMGLMKLLPLFITDRLLVLYAFFALGRTEKYGIFRPRTGPLETKAKFGKTPVLDMGAFAKIRSGSIKVMPALDFVTPNGAAFVDGQSQGYDVILLATGFRSNIPSWLKDDENQFSTDGMPKSGWNCGRGLFVAGMTRQGILGASQDAVSISDEISKEYALAQQAFVSKVVRH